MAVELEWQFYDGRPCKEPGPGPLKYLVAVGMTCDVCGCTGGEDDSETWSCPCRCHDGWKFIQDGKRYRDQLARGDAGCGSGDPCWFLPVHGVVSGLRERTGVLE